MKRLMNLTDFLERSVYLGGQLRKGRGESMHATPIFCIMTNRGERDALSLTFRHCPF